MCQFSSQTDSILAQLIKLAVQSALPTALLSLIGAVLAYAFSVNSLYANVTGATWSPLTGLYALSLVATLAGRERIREAAARTVACSFRESRSGVVSATVGVDLGEGGSAEKGRGRARVVGLGGAGGSGTSSDGETKGQA